MITRQHWPWFSIQCATKINSWDLNLKFIFWACNWKNEILIQHRRWEKITSSCREFDDQSIANKSRLSDARFFYFVLPPHGNSRLKFFFAVEIIHLKVSSFRSWKEKATTNLRILEHDWASRRRWEFLQIKFSLRFRLSFVVKCCERNFFMFKRDIADD